MLDQLPRREVRARIDRHEVTIPIELPQFEVQALERVSISSADVADGVASADVLRPRAIEIRTDRDDRLQIRVVRRPAVAVVDDAAKALAEPSGKRDLTAVARERSGHGRRQV